MGEYFFVEPEVAGELGEKTIMDTSIHPPIIEKLNYQFDGWLGDVLIESFPCFIITLDAGKKLQEARLSGLKFDSVEVTKSDQFEDMYPGRELPDFVWLKPQGTAGIDDVAVGSDKRLVLSKRALDLLSPIGLSR